MPGQRSTRDCPACGGRGTFPPVDITDPDYVCSECDGSGEAAREVGHTTATPDIAADGCRCGLSGPDGLSLIHFTGCPADRPRAER